MSCFFSIKVFDLMETSSKSSCYYWLLLLRIKNLKAWGELLLSFTSQDKEFGGLG